MKFRRPRIVVAVCGTLLGCAGFAAWQTSWGRCDDEIRLRFVPPVDTGTLHVLLTGDAYAASCSLLLPEVAPGRPDWRCQGDPISVVHHEWAIVGLSTPRFVDNLRVVLQREREVVVDVRPNIVNTSQPPICRMLEAHIVWPSSADRASD